jgi:hypothetical protein
MCSPPKRLGSPASCGIPRGGRARWRDLGVVAEKICKARDRPDGRSGARYRASLGLVDIKVCSIDAIWSGLKFVIPKEQR